MLFIVWFFFSYAVMVTHLWNLFLSLAVVPQTKIELKSCSDNFLVRSNKFTNDVEMSYFLVNFGGVNYRFRSLKARAFGE